MPHFAERSISEKVAAARLAQRHRPDLSRPGKESGWWRCASRAAGHFFADRPFGEMGHYQEEHRRALQERMTARIKALA